jgi:hypothetical protein
MELPRYFIVGERPVKFVSTPDGGMDVLALDWKTGEFVREMRYLSKCSEGGGEVDEVEEAAFLAKVAQEVAEIRAKAG